MVAAVREVSVKAVTGGKLPKAVELSEPWMATKRVVFSWFV